MNLPRKNKKKRKSINSAALHKSPTDVVISSCKAFVKPFPWDIHLVEGDENEIARQLT